MNDPNHTIKVNATDLERARITVLVSLRITAFILLHLHTYSLGEAKTGDKPATHNYIRWEKDLHLSREWPFMPLNQSLLENMTELRCDPGGFALHTLPLPSHLIVRSNQP